MYSIAPDSYKDVFVLPRAVANDHLRHAGKAQLKLLLCVFSHPGEDLSVDELSALTGVPRDEVADDMLYWLDAGFISTEAVVDRHVNEQSAKTAAQSAAAAPAAPAVSEAPAAEPAPARLEERYTKPSISEVAQRTAESPEIASLFVMLQNELGRTIGYDAQTNILMLIDHYGLPVEVVSMLFSYAKSVGRAGSMSYVMNLGKRWAEDGVLTFAEAEAQIRKLENADRLWGEFKARTGIDTPRPTQRQSEYLFTWNSVYGFDADMIVAAYERAAEKKGRIDFSYMNGILTKWNKSGFRTLDDVKKADSERASGSKRKQAASPDAPPPSYDLDAIMESVDNFDPTKTKNS